MISWSWLLATLFACSGQPDAPAPPEVGDDPNMTYVVLQGEMLYLNGGEVCELHKPGVLRASRHRKLQKMLRVLNGLPEDVGEDEVEAGLSDPGRSIQMTIPAQTPYEDLYPLLVTSAWAGFGTFYLAVEGAEETLGPILLDSRLPALWAGEAAAGVVPDLEIRVSPDEVLGWLRFQLAVAGDDAWARARRVPRSLRVMGATPLADCNALYSADVRLQAICLEGQRDPQSRFREAPGGPVWPPEVRDEGAYLTLGSQHGCLAGGHGADNGEPAWRDETVTSLQALGIDNGFLVTLNVDQAVSSGDLLQILGAFPAAGLSFPTIKSLKPKPAEGRGCEALLRDRRALDEAAARWLGELRAP